ncbi:Calcium-transporting ATPase CtpE [Apilactobacillus kunkeei]|nr:HAD-IC family P-type ATPase [Apilactobacillus sp.]TPR54162.1 HAD family hydrolase [Apilactobacillus kunkeei]CAI2558296.1 Calcium-transporting ATPase CtpE [Apilactobacillus kunkeei]CAI2558413.1 Calcium-transporting ATPase CtpE [Apilactobacillus kunkeei]
MQSRIDSQKGLTTIQAKHLYDQGLHNTKRKGFTKTIPQILQGNAFTLFNFINIVLAAMVFYTGDYKNLLFLVIAISNTIIGSIQEIRSKRQLDKMAILSQGLIRVVRDGQIKKVEDDHIVLGDVLLIGHGDQIPIDGKVLTSDSLQVDESQITGETNSIEKQHGDSVTSGSVVLSGSARIVATEVGEDTFVNRMEFEVSRTKKDSDSKMLKTINKIIKWLTFVIVPLGALLLYTKIMRGDDINQAMLGTVAAMIGMIPEGLVLLSSVTLAVSAAKLARHKVLVRALPAIETLARVDTICLDKTGTITSGKLKLEDVLPFNNHSKDELRHILGSLVYAFEDDNETSAAIKQAISNPNVVVLKSFPFSSDKKWSGVQTNEGNYIMGAPQFIIENMTKEVSDTISNYANQGYRVMALLKSNKDLTDDLDDAELLGLVLISDEIRPDAKSTLEYFVEQGVSLKVISGDDPKTVSAIASRVGLKDSDKTVDMTQVPFDADYQELVKDNAVFGRVTPQQKKRLIRSYQLNGNTVAMTGDGVNDMLAMKQANCGIAMASGSESTKGIADFVLINSNFSAMIDVLAEGRRVINNIGSVASLYLIKTMFSLSLTILFMFSIHSYPFQPIQLTPINTFMVGLPSFLLALAPNYQRVTNQFSAKIYNIALPAAMTIVGYVVLIIYIGKAFHFDYVQRATISVLVTGFIYWIALFKASRPLNRVKLSIIIPSIVIFASIFIFFPSIFSLVDVFKMPIFIPAALVVVTAVPVFILMSSVVRRILIKINPSKFDDSI